MKWIIIISLLILGIYLNNASWLRSAPSKEMSYLAHRGVHQTYSKKDLSDDECTAIRIHEPTHDFLENTIESIEHAFAYGAEIVEIDIKITKDKQFAVFHDATIDCRTNGKGQTRKHSLAYLQSLDIGYGYTHDNGKTFPFRGKGIAKMPSLTQVLDHFKKEKFLINIKDGHRSVPTLLNQFLQNRHDEDLSRLSFYGRGAPTEQLLALNPALKGFNKKSVKTCALHYSLIGWTGYVPKACRNTFMPLPYDYASYFWGWPTLLVNRMNSVNTRVILLDTQEGHLRGLDDQQKLNSLPKDFKGMVWTDTIEHTIQKHQRADR